MLLDFGPLFGGDIFQIVLSNCFGAEFSGSLFNTYRVLRTLNPSPCMFYFSCTPPHLKRLLNFERRRGETPEGDKLLENDPKELLAAEHDMLVDLGSVSKFGSVEVDAETLVRQ